jgi:Xaa-Pro aminopeptidase
MLATPLPEITPAEYEQRLYQLRERMAQAELDIIAVYSDEYHFENCLYLSGYRPRFEMALLVIDLETRPLLIVGLEGPTLAEMTAPHCEISTYVPFSVQGMRDTPVGDLKSLLARRIKTPDPRIGVVGPRYFLGADFAAPNRQHAVPSFIVDALNHITAPDRVSNATALLTHLPTGMRTSKSATEIALLEEAGTRASWGVRAMLEAIRPGMSERELLGEAEKVAPSALFSYTPVIHSGIERCNAGLDSPGERKISRGDPVVVYYSPSVSGYSGNSGRSALLIDGVEDLPVGLREPATTLYEGTYESYRSLVEALGLGRTLSEVAAAGMSPLRRAGITPLYVPLHATGLSEWENAFQNDAPSPNIESGYVFQVDLTVRLAGFPYGPAKIEDGFAIVDEALQEEIQQVAPVSWARITERRAAMAELGFSLAPHVLPLSDIAGQFTPFLLNP